MTSLLTIPKQIEIMERQLNEARYEVAKLEGGLGVLKSLAGEPYAHQEVTDEQVSNLSKKLYPEDVNGITTVGWKAGYAPPDPEPGDIDPPQEVEAIDINPKKKRGRPKKILEGGMDTNAIVDMVRRGPIRLGNGKWTITQFSDKMKCSTTLLFMYHKDGLLVAYLTDKGKKYYTKDHIPMYESARKVMELQKSKALSKSTTRRNKERTKDKYTGTLQGMG